MLGTQGIIAVACPLLVYKPLVISCVEVSVKEKVGRTHKTHIETQQYKCSQCLKVVFAGLVYIVVGSHFFVSAIFWPGHSPFI